MDKLKSITKGTKSIADFQWRFVVSTANSRLLDHSECFIQIKFVLKDYDNNLSELQLDLSMSEFNQLYREMEKINNMIQIVN